MQSPTIVESRFFAKNNSDAQCPNSPKVQSRTDPPVKSTIGQGPSGTPQYVLHLKEYTLTLNVMAMNEVPRHIEGFAGYVKTIQGGSLNKRGKQIIEQILRTRQVIGVLVEPAGVETTVWLAVVCAVAELSKSLVFVRGTLLDYDDNVVLAPGGRSDPSAKIDPTAAWKRRPFWLQWLQWLKRVHCL